jgi:acylphosphatase
LEKDLSYKIIVKGRVQGVGYRAFVSKIAKGFSLKGYVKNMPNGTVEIEAEGTREMLDKFVISCKIGPGWAHIENINQIETPAQGYQEFKIKY